MRHECWGEHVSEQRCVCECSGKHVREQGCVSVSELMHGAGVGGFLRQRVCV